MKNILDPIYRKDYFEGHTKGLNPFATIKGRKKAAFIAGFNSGRLEYEGMNGFISQGIPERIVTEKVLEDFLVAGMFGFSIETDEYTTHQINVISKWYQSGIEKYDPTQHHSLYELLEENGIEIE